MLREPSNEFVRAVGSDCSVVADCELCGRTHFCNDQFAGYDDDDELEKLLEKHKENPDKFVAQAGSIGYGTINGKQAVMNCQCNRLREFEDWIWLHRHIVARYVEARTRNRAEAALSDEAEAEFLASSVERTAVDEGKEFGKCQGCGGYFDKLALDDRLLCIRCARERATEEEKRERQCKEDERNSDVFDEDDRLPF